MNIWIIVLIVLVICVLLFGLAWLGKSHSPAKVGGYDDYDYDDEYDDDYEFYGGGRLPYLGIRPDGFKAAMDGKKTVFIRLRRGMFGPDARHPLKAGDEIVIGRSRPREGPGSDTEHKGPRRYTTTVVKITKHEDMDSLLDSIGGHAKAFPGKTKAQGKKELAQFIMPADIGDHGLVAIEVKPPSAEAIKEAKARMKH